jgi:hypothetical protein
MKDAPEGRMTRTLSIMPHGVPLVISRDFAQGLPYLIWGGQEWSYGGLVLWLHVKHPPKMHVLKAWLKDDRFLRSDLMLKDSDLINGLIPQWIYNMMAYWDLVETRRWGLVGGGRSQVI